MAWSGWKFSDLQKFFIVAVGLFIILLPAVKAQKAGNIYAATDFDIPRVIEPVTIQNGEENFFLATLPSNLNVHDLPGNLVSHYLSSAQAIVLPSARNLLLEWGATLQPVAAGWKVSTNLLQRLKRGQVPLRVIVFVQNPEAFDQQVTPTLALKASTRFQKHWIAFDGITASEFSLLLVNPAIWQVQDNDRKAMPELSVESFDRSLNGGVAVAARWPNIDGQGTLLNIKEQLFDTLDIDFASRYKWNALSSRQPSGHASIMASMAGGAGNSSAFSKGYAPGTSLSSASFDNLLPEPMDWYNSQGVNIQNHSYGVGVESSYAPDAAAYDASVWERPTLLHVFSAGNAGNQVSTEGPYQNLAGFANITGSFKMSKNSIVVAAVDSMAIAEAASSSGPAYDGRIKPELAAFGEDGSSGAAAIVSGTAALLQQLALQKSGQLASAALLKALLINGSKDIKQPGPDYKLGYGVLQAANSMAMLNDGQYATPTFTQSVKKWQQTITVASNTSRIAVTICWTDTAANPGSFRAIVNDLDMLLVTPDGDTILPWILNRDASIMALSEQAARGRDSVNVVEQISIQNPKAGNYTLIVLANKLVTREQPFAIAWQAPLANALVFLNPAGKTAIDIASGIMLRWQSSYDASVFASLWIQNLATGNKTVINPQQLLQESARLWQPAGTGNAFIAKAGFSLGNEEILSDSFVVSARPKLFVGFNCTDSLMVYWSPIAGVNNYRIYALQNGAMVLQKQTSDTFWIAQKKSIPSLWLMVRPMVQGLEGTQSATININNQGIDCYIRTFYADYISDLKVADINLSLGTLYGVKTISLEKRRNNDYTVLATYTENLTTAYNIKDANLITGGNYYRAVIRLTNGAIIYSELEVAYYTGEGDYILFPNPVQANQPVYLLNRFDSASYAELYDASGRKIKRIVLTDLVQTLSIKGLASGIYFLIIHNGEMIIDRKKLLVQ